MEADKYRARAAELIAQSKLEPDEDAIPAKLPTQQNVDRKRCKQV
jgi:hypothetical protein